MDYPELSSRVDVLLKHLGVDENKRSDLGKLLVNIIETLILKHEIKCAKQAQEFFNQGEDNE